MMLSIVPGLIGAKKTSIYSMDINFDSDEDNDNEAENITVTIDQNKVGSSFRQPPPNYPCEMMKLDAIINMPSMLSSTMDTDLEMQTELSSIIRNSITPTTPKCIAINFNNRIILVPFTQPLSSRLQSLFWAPAKQYTETKLKLFEVDIMSQLAQNLNVTSINNQKTASTSFDAETQQADVQCLNSNETVAIFSARYYKQNPGRGNNNTGFYYYTDFAVIIIRNMKIIEYAIHGYVSNINELLLKYNPQSIIYNSSPNKGLDVFLRYPYQPFFAGITDQSKLKPITIHRFHGTFNTLAFCERSETYCAFCNALRDIRGLIFQLATKQSMDQLTPTSNLTTTKRQLLQTTGKTDQQYESERQHRPQRLCSIVFRPPQKQATTIAHHRHGSGRHRQRNNNEYRTKITSKKSWIVYPYHQKSRHRNLKHAPKKAHRRHIN